MGLEEVPSTRYAQGVDVGFVYVNVPDSAVPAGVYRIHVSAKANDIRVGTYTGSAGFFDLYGNEVVQLPVTFDTTALEVPTQVHHVSKAKVKVVIGHSHVAFTVADVTACGQVVIQSF